MKTENIVEVIAIVLIGIIVLVCILELSKISKEQKQYLIDKNAKIVDCQSRGNTLDWCLEIFNR